MTLSDLINLERVKIEKETTKHYQVKYKDEVYRINKSDESSFIINGNSSITPEMGMSLEPRLELIVTQDMEIFQDESVPKGYKEVMMFHELREIEYQDAGFEDAHERAVNDEILYVLKFFNKRKRDKYLKFASEYRASKLAEVEEDKTQETKEDIVIEEDEKYRALFVLRYGQDVYDDHFCAYVITTDQNIHDGLMSRLQSAYQMGFKDTILGSGFEYILANYLDHFRPILVVDQSFGFLPQINILNESLIHKIQYDEGNFGGKIDYVFSLLKQLHEQSGKK